MAEQPVDTNSVDRHSFDSTWILEGTYRPWLQELTVTTRNGGSYTSLGVPPDLWEGMCAAASPGSFYIANIKGKY